MMQRICYVGVGMLLLAGCRQTLEEQARPPKKKSIIHKTTQDIGKYDPAAGLVVSDSKVKATNPLTGPLEAYGPMVEQVSKLGIDMQVQIFEVQHEHYPTYDEFMSQIIKKNNIRLPVLPGGMKYQYDEENHKLVVVHPQTDEAETPQKTN